MMEGVFESPPPGEASAFANPEAMGVKTGDLVDGHELPPVVIAGVVPVLLESAKGGGAGTPQPVGELRQSENPRHEEDPYEREFLS
jgi:hypothetical protein